MSLLLYLTLTPRHVYHPKRVAQIGGKRLGKMRGCLSTNPRVFNARFYEAYIHQLINNPPTPMGKAVALPTPPEDMAKDPRRDAVVKFDDCQRTTGTMIEAKGTGYVALMAKGELATLWVLSEWRGQSMRQESAADAQGRPIFWFFAEKDAAIAARALFESEERNITVIYMPLPGAKP
jgi:hypothetical protein